MKRKNSLPSKEFSFARTRGLETPLESSEVSSCEGFSSFPLPGSQRSMW